MKINFISCMIKIKLKCYNKLKFHIRDCLQTLRYFVDIKNLTLINNNIEYNHNYPNVFKLQDEIFS